MKTFTRVAVGGLTSDVGKTTLACEILRAFRGWEAIKVTRGHYRSCGKDPHACCVSHLLGDEPVVRSGRAETYAEGKDTGRFWDAGASDVHWVIATDGQVERGIKTALGRVRAEGVVIEGNSFLNYVGVDFFVMVARPGGAKIKPTARRALPKVDALYLSNFGEEEIPGGRGVSSASREGAGLPDVDLPLYTSENVRQLIEVIRGLHGRAGADSKRVSRPGRGRTSVSNLFKLFHNQEGNDV